MRTIFQSFISLLFPNECIGCGRLLTTEETHLCLHCLHQLKFDNYNPKIGEAITQRLGGRVKLKFAYAPFNFLADGVVQNIIHQIKYKGNKNAAKWIGARVGSFMAQADKVSLSDSVLVPVPLHQSKLLSRGYNQSLLFAEGISSSSKIQLCPSTLIRYQKRMSQTSLSRYKRWSNTDETYQIQNLDLIYNKDVVLVDDVITTGATIESCVIELLKANPKSVSVISIALAEKL